MVNDHTVLFDKVTAPQTFDALGIVLQSRGWNLINTTDGAPDNIPTEQLVSVIAWFGPHATPGFFEVLATLLKPKAERFVLFAPGAGEARPWDALAPLQRDVFEHTVTVCPEANGDSLVAALERAAAQSFSDDALLCLRRTTIDCLPACNPDRFFIQVMSWYGSDKDGHFDEDLKQACDVLRNAISLSLVDCDTLNETFARTQLNESLKRIQPTKELLGLLAEVRGERAAGQAQALEGGEHRFTRGLEEAIQNALKGRDTSGNDLRLAAVNLRLVELLRDIGNCVAEGAGDWARKQALFDNPLKLLLVDDHPEKIKPSLECALGIFHDGDTALSVASESYWKELVKIVEQWHLPGHSKDPPKLQVHDDAHDYGLYDFDIILVDIEFEGRPLGAKIVRQIASWLDKKPDEDRPRVIVLSLSRDTEQIQQALNLGAEAYVLKERVFGLPAVLAGGRRRSPLVEPRGSKSAFRSLYRLPPRVVAGLQRDICGAEGESVRSWLRALPKADLHHHIGTCISLPTIQALAWNTFGYVQGTGQTLSWLEDLASGVWHTVLKAGLLQHSERSAAVALWRSSAGANGKPLPRSGVLDDVVKWLKPAGSDIEDFEVTALLVAVLSLAANEDETSFDSWDQLKGIDELAKKQCALTENIWSLVISLLREWRRPPTQTEAQKTFDDKSWTDAANVIQMRVRGAQDWLKRVGKAAGWSRNSPSLTLADIVGLPSHPAPGERSLARYLWGAGLLGADHLQLPENIVLAAIDLARQATEDNIVYSEVRCATNGYTKGGMSAVGATDLLCRSLDLAAAFFALCENERRWVRFNVLLGAKRHKKMDEFDKAVGLLSNYLQRKGPDRCLGSDTLAAAPEWWKLCKVAGFDLSGDEEVAAEKFKDHVGPLFESCASITIHAGEAASADSVWQATYMLGARRIGHGLRLRENRELLNYCITEGICMEMCPISNEFTGSFAAPTHGDKSHDFKERKCYPLRYYMEQGLEVCLGTDNRYLHARPTLTDEYLEAARLVGGLTKWEVLKLVKAGFKHAFLPKEEVETLLRAVEEEIFDLVITADTRP